VLTWFASRASLLCERHIILREGYSLTCRAGGFYASWPARATTFSTSLPAPPARFHHTIPFLQHPTPLISTPSTFFQHPSPLFHRVISLFQRPFPFFQRPFPLFHDLFSLFQGTIPLFQGLFTLFHDLISLFQHVSAFFHGLFSLFQDVSPSSHRPFFDQTRAAINHHHPAKALPHRIHPPQPSRYASPRHCTSAALTTSAFGDLTCLKISSAASA
jgi:hypothetical protein